MVLFLSRDWAGGAGPVVDCPRTLAPVPAGAPAVAVVDGAAVAVVVLSAAAVVVAAAG